MSDRIRIDSFYPYNVPTNAGNTMRCTIRGRGFRYAGPQMWFEQINPPFLAVAFPDVYSDDVITAVLPALQTAGPIRLRIDDRDAPADPTVLENACQPTYNFPVPRIDSMAPEVAPLNASMTPPDWLVMMATGGGFGPTPGRFDLVRYRLRGQAGPGEGPIGYNSDTAMQFVAPTAITPTAVDVSFKEAVGQSWGEWINCVFCCGSPELPGFFYMSPTEGQAGALLTCYGTNLQNAWGLRIGTALVPYQSSVAGSLQAQVPLVTGIVQPTPLDVSIVYKAGEDYPAGDLFVGQFRMLPPGYRNPVASDYSPQRGSVDGGETVYIRGTDLHNVDTIEFGTRNGSILYRSYDEIIVTSPPAVNFAPATVNLRWRSDPTTAVIIGGYEYIIGTSAQPPQVQSFVPISGPTTGGTVVNIIGSDLDRIDEVRFGGVPATDLDRTFGRLICRTPSRPVGGDVQVELYYPQGRVVAPGTFTYSIVPEPPTAAVTCRRAAWLTLADGRELALEDDLAGYVLAELDIAWPEVRDVVNNRPSAHGVDDRTRLFGARVVSAHVVAGPWGTRTMDDIARAFGPFLVPGARPVLHWIIDSPETVYAERTLELRASAYSSPISGMERRDILMAWSAPDPIIRGSIDQLAIGRPPYLGMIGRQYPLTFDRHYPATGGTGAVLGRIVTIGDVDVQPLLRIFGPITAPSVVINSYPQAERLISRAFVFRQSFRIDAGRWVDVDTVAHTAIADDGSRQEAQIDWARTEWPTALGGGVLNTLALNGSNVNHVTQVVAIWRDGFLAA
jgi:hypothetical protein